MYGHDYIVNSLYMENVYTSGDEIQELQWKQVKSGQVNKDLVVNVAPHSLSILTVK